MSTLSIVSNLPPLHSEGGLPRYLAAIRKFPLLDPADEAMYARRWREDGDREAAYRLVTSHLRLAAKLALRYRGYGLPVADLISEANVGLMLAVKRFKPEKGVQLATYAMWWIKATLHEYVLKSWSLVKIGTTAARRSCSSSSENSRAKFRQARKPTCRRNRLVTSPNSCRSFPARSSR